MLKHFSTKVFIDGGDPEETKTAVQMLSGAGYAGPDGQTTNPSLVAKNPYIADRVARGDKLTSAELWREYRKIVEQMSATVPGDISVEVYADKNTQAEEMVEQARECVKWAEGVVIKLPIINEGLKAAQILKAEARLNMTLCFSQEQTAAVYGATIGSKYPVYVSPFIGRLDDIGLNGMDLIENIMRMLSGGDGHVHVLAASLRGLQHVLQVLEMKAQAMTLPFEKAFKPWAESGFLATRDDSGVDLRGERIDYISLDLNKEWREFDINHALTDKGLKNFAEDWNGLLL